MKNDRKIVNFRDAKEYIYNFIPKENATLYPGDFGLRRMKYFMSLFDNPQDKFKSIHIAGTSGKGSTAYLTSLLLISHGFKVGLILKPHIFDIRERYQINNKFISERDFCIYVNRLIPKIKRMEKTEYGLPTFAEINTALAYIIFADKKVNFAVIETYLGGTYDCTNVINRSNKLVVLSKIGFDHTKILGNTLSLIASQKAGIIQNNNLVIALAQKAAINQQFQIRADLKNTKIIYIKSNKNFKNIKNASNGIFFDYFLSIPNLHIRINKINLSLHGEFQAENAALAVTAFISLAQINNFKFSESKIRTEFSKANFKGRMEILKVLGKTIILDGAHNPQKMKAFLDSLKAIYPDRKFTFLVAFMIGKDAKKMLKIITPVAQRITISSFFVENQDWIRKAYKPEALLKYLSAEKFIVVGTISDIKNAFKNAIDNTDDILIITGSQYFISEIYKMVKWKNEKKSRTKLIR